MPTKTTPVERCGRCVWSTPSLTDSEGPFYRMSEWRVLAGNEQFVQHNRREDGNARTGKPALDRRQFNLLGIRSEGTV